MYVKRIEELEHIIAYHEKLYRDGNPEISDFEYDIMVSELRDLYSGNIPNDSILNKIIASTPVDKFEKTEHLTPMLSLSNTYNIDELQDWLSKTSEQLHNQYNTFCVQEKIDGCSLSCIYEHGKLKRIVTRGDGVVGEDITCNKFIIDNIPDTLTNDETIDIRGEVYMEYNEFKRINDELIKNNDEPYANPRNLTAGTIKLLDRNIIKTRKLKFIVHTFGSSTTPYYFLEEFYEDCKRWGFKTVNTIYCYGDSNSNSNSVIQAINNIDNLRKTLPYPIDGAVVKLDSIEEQNKLGNTSKSPRWGIAYKYEAEKAEAKVLNITLQVGRTGQITPVAELSPVQLSGTIVKRATCHNIDEMIARDIRINDTVLVEKSGEIIPYIIKSLPEKRDINSKPYVFDEKCPICGAKAVKHGDKKSWYCSNKHCPSVLQQKFEYFVSRNCMNIEGVSGKLIEKLISQGILNEFSDLYNITYQDIIKLEKIGETSANNILTAINKSRDCELWRVINSIGLPGIGKTNAKAIAQDCGDVDEFLRRLKDENCATWFKGIGSIGDIISQDIADSANEFIAIVEQLIQVLHVQTCNTLSTGKLSGKKICITGVFEQPRDTLIQIIESAGGKYVSSISKKTDYLLAGEDCGSKLKKAQQYNIPIVHSISELID